MGHNAHHQQCAEAVAGMECDPKATQQHEGEHQENQARTNKPQLLTDGGEDEVVALLGEIEELLPSLAQACAEQSARADGDEALHHLIAVVGAVQPRVVPHIDAACAVGDNACIHQRHEAPCSGGNAAYTCANEPRGHAAHRHHNSARAHNEDGARQVGLQEHQHGDNRQPHAVGQHTLAQVSHPLFFLGNTVGKIDDDRQLGDLRRLEGEDTVNAQPAGGVILGNTHPWDNDQQQQEDG